MTADFRALCVELTDCLEKADWPHKQKHVFEQWLYIARKALAEPEPEGPTDDELDELFVEIDQSGESESWRAYARAVLARWGRSNGPAVPDGREPASVASEPSDAGPADGEVAELVAWLRMYGSIGRQVLDQTPWTASQLDRAADLLERPSPPQPVPVAERLPGPGDCDGEGRCWLCGKVQGDWRLLNPEKSGVPQLKYCFSHWLPAHALPVPQ